MRDRPLWRAYTVGTDRARKLRRSVMAIDPTVSVGNLLTLVTSIAAFAIFLMTFRTDIQVLITRIAQIDKEMAGMREEIRAITMTTDRIGTVLIEMATTRTRLDAQEKRYDDLVVRLHSVEALAHVGRGAAAMKRKAKP